MPDDDGKSRAPQRIVERSMLRVAEVRLEYLRCVQGVADKSLQRLNREFHAEVLGYWLALKPYSWSDGIQEKWDSAKLWQEGGEWVEGLDELGRWINRERRTTAAPSKRGSSAEQVSEPDVLPPDRLIRIAGILDDIARQLGVSMSVSKGARPAAMVPQISKDDDLEAHGETEAAADGGERG
jgi:hypothetical protein